MSEAVQVRMLAASQGRRARGVEMACRRCGRGADELGPALATCGLGCIATAVGQGGLLSGR